MFRLLLYVVRCVVCCNCKESGYECIGVVCVVFFGFVIVVGLVFVVVN